MPQTALHSLLCSLPKPRYEAPAGHWGRADSGCKVRQKRWMPARNRRVAGGPTLCSHLCFAYEPYMSPAWLKISQQGGSLRNLVCLASRPRVSCFSFMCKALGKKCLSHGKGGRDHARGIACNNLVPPYSHFFCATGCSFALVA